MRFLLLILLFLTSTVLLAEVDHPLVGAYPGTSIKSYAVTNYAEIVLPLNKITDNAEFSSKSILGKHTGHIYFIEGEHSPLQIAENYLDVVKRLGGKLILVCRSDCGRNFSDELLKSRHWTRNVFLSMATFSQGSNEHYYILAQLGPDTHPTYIQWFIRQPYGDRVEIGQIISEPQQLQLGLVTISPEALSNSPGSSPAATSLGPDSAKGGDHPLISRYAGAKLTHRTDTEYTEVRLPTGIANNNKQVPHLTLAGKSTLLHYEASKDQSTLQVFRNYQQALKDAGFNILFSCEHQSCGDEQRKLLWQGSPDWNRFKSYLSNSNDKDDDYRMLTAHKTVNKQDIYLSIYVLKASGSTNVNIAHDIVELSSMQTNRVSIDTAYLQNELSRSGKVVLHGLHFATDSASLLAESDTALAVITDYLKTHPSQQFYVVGHTDNSGSHSHNIQLSKARANSVLQALIKQGISTERLLAEGVGAMSPQQHNANTEGKAANRRVELVLR
ncbi:OmpA family protein [Rheinheimera baltica]|uniref:OmpA family protein n=1 Tax=Rheinheimera baltica TaxID=67576 RepID=UPI0004091BD2|nr:OmpA family protein [Rheinheimera baltica]MDP5144197.1 OmpA family protein [Rheinheimera baltica]MDP5149017.1 OmpA family protein [Rheinheimera baltica]